MISSRWFTPSVLGLVLCVTSIISVWIYGPRAARFDGVCLLHTGLRRAGIRTSTCTTAQLDGMLTIPRRLIFTYGNTPTSPRCPLKKREQQQQTVPLLSPIRIAQAAVQLCTRACCRVALCVSKPEAARDWLS